MKKICSRSYNYYFILSVFILLYSGAVFSQTTNYTPVSETGKPYTIIITSATINGVSVDAGDEVAVLDQQLVVGATVYAEKVPFPLTAWEKDDSQSLPGFTPSNTMTFKIWDKSENREYQAQATYIEGDGTFGYGAYTICSLEAKSYTPPTVTATASPDSGKIPLVVSFTATGTDLDGTISSYQWNFGDGTISTIQNPTHTYSEPGEYNVSITVTDNDGLTGSASLLIRVLFSNASPVVAASAVPDSGTVPLIVTFFSAGYDEDGSIASYSWDFDDGHTSTLQYTSHMFQTAGNYTVVVTVTDTDGDKGRDTVYVKVSSVTGIDQVDIPVPLEYSLAQNYPNPFNPTTRIRFSIPFSGDVQLQIYDLLGRNVISLVNRFLDSGTYSIGWNGRNSAGKKVSSGEYIYVLKSRKFVCSKKMIVLK